MRADVDSEPSCIRCPTRLKLQSKQWQWGKQALKQAAKVVPTPMNPQVIFAVEAARLQSVSVTETNQKSAVLITRSTVPSRPYRQEGPSVSSTSLNKVLFVFTHFLTSTESSGPSNPASIQQNPPHLSEQHLTFTPLHSSHSVQSLRDDMIKILAC